MEIKVIKKRNFSKNILLILIFIQIDLNSDYWQDKETYLIWEVKSETNINQEMTFLEALDYCDNLELDGYSDWWLPSVSQARTLAHFPIYGEYNDDWEQWFEYYGPYTNNGFFVKYQLAYNMGVSGDYWVVSEKVSFAKSAEDFAWYIDYTTGYDDWSYTTAQNYVRCVRADF
jgi:hypothetical protein